MQIIKNSTIYLGSSIVSKAMPFLMLPILTKYLSPNEYGLLSIFLIFLSIYLTLIGMGSHSNISRNFFRLEKLELAKNIGNIIFILFLATIFYLSITFLIFISVENIFSIPTFTMLIIPFIAFMQMINNLNTTILRNEQRAYIFGLFEFLAAIFTFLFTLLFLIVLHLGWMAQIYAIFTTSAIFCIVGFVYMRKRGYLDITYDKEHFRSILKISAPLVPHTLGGLIIAASDRFFIGEMVGLEATGLYTVGYSFGMVITIFAEAFINAWSPWFYKNIINPTDGRKLKIVKYTYLYILGLFLLAFLISLVAEFFLPYVVDTRYLGAAEFIIWIAIGYAIRGVYQIFFPYLIHLSKTHFLAFSTVVAALLNLILNYFFIKTFGAIGAAYATAVAFTASAGLVFWYQQRNYKMPWFYFIKYKRWKN